jgi:hypothetical protein
VVTAHEHERSASTALAAIRYLVPRWSPAWAIPEVPVPESQVHDQAIEYVRALLLAWAARCERQVEVLRNIGIRWVPSEPRAGFDPDLCLLDPAPQLEEGLTSLRLWESGLAAPCLAIEVVSANHPYKDYVDTPERAAACGIGELWVYDPLLAGPKQHGGPFLLQVWQSQGSSLERVHAGSGPAYSQRLQAWLHPRASRRPTEARLVVSDDVEARAPWPTLLEQIAERERHASERQRRRADAAEQRAEANRQRAESEKQRAEAAEKELAALRAVIEQS